MAYEQRLPMIKRLGELRGSTVICYLTSLRPGVPGMMAEDQVRVLFDHLNALPAKRVKKLDVYLCSNGGSGTVPWRLVALFREFAESFNVLIPYRAYSAASLLALGADEIVMHPFAELGPIDPSVSNDYNPLADDGTGRRLAISVEDVRAYVGFIKDTVGITHEDELIQAIRILGEKVHPLALGNVERFVMQSRMIAKKILRTHMRGESDDHKINELVETMASKLYFHGHPINRTEARNDLHLKVPGEVPSEIEQLMWSLYLDFEKQFKNQDVFNAPALTANVPNPPTPGATSAPQLVDLIHAIVESEKISSVHSTHRQYRKIFMPTGQIGVQEDVLTQEWNHLSAPSAPAADQTK